MSGSNYLGLVQRLTLHQDKRVDGQGKAAATLLIPGVEATFKDGGGVESEPHHQSPVEGDCWHAVNPDTACKLLRYRQVQQQLEFPRYGLLLVAVDEDTVNY